MQHYICHSSQLSIFIIYHYTIYHYTNKTLSGHVSSVRGPVFRLKTSHLTTVAPWIKNAFLSPLFLRFLILRFYFCPFFAFLSPVLSPRCVPEPSPTCFPRHFLFLSPNSMDTGSFSLIRFFYVFFFYLYLHLHTFFYFGFLFFQCTFVISSKVVIFYLRKLRFLSPNSMYTGSFSCFVCQSEYRFVFLLRFPSPSSIFFFFYLYLHLHAFFYFGFLFFHWMFIVSSKALIFMSESFDFYLQTLCTQVGFLALSVQASIFLCSWAFSDVLPPPFSIFISKLHVHRFVFLLSLSKLKFFCVPELSRSWFPPFSFFF